MSEKEKKIMETIAKAVTSEAGRVGGRRNNRMEVRDMDELRSKVIRKCLERAEILLDRETAPTAETARAVRELVETAISIQRSRYESPIGPGAAIHLKEI